MVETLRSTAHIRAAGKPGAAAGTLGKPIIGSQWVIDPKVFQQRTFKTEYAGRVNDTGRAPRPHVGLRFASGAPGTAPARAPPLSL